MLHRKVALVVIAVFALVWALAVSQRARPGAEIQLRPQIAASRVKPAGRSANEEVEAPSLGFIDFTYEVENRGQSPIRGLRVGTKCACEAVGSPPEELLPGERALLSFRLRAPRAGVMQKIVPLLANGIDEPVAVLDVALRVRFEPPALMPRPADLSVTFVSGSQSTQEFVLEASEVKRVEPWIIDLDVNPAGSVEVEAVQVEELPEADSSLTLRRYHFPLVNRSLPAGRHTVYATVRTRDGLPLIPDSLMLRVDVVDSVAIVPNPLVFKYGNGAPPQSRRIKVMKRTGGQANITAGEYDHDLLEVALAQQADPIVAFDIVPIAAPSSGRETEVRFNVEGAEGQILVVRFEPTTP